MMDWYGGMGWGGWLVACLMMIAFLALIERLARGEIDMEEYTRTLDVLRRGEDVRRVG
jgi:hypothetical protein